MAVVKGYVEKIKYRNEDNGYTVLSLSNSVDGEEYILVGSFSYISEGEFIEASGQMTEHPIYGEQMAVESYEVTMPEDTVSIERYLGSGAIKGIGAALASRIVKKFKKDTFRIMEEEPERLAEIKGISERMAMAIGEQVEEKRDMRQAMMFLQEYGIAMNLAVKIYREYGPAMYEVLKTNPYKLADDIPGVGFKMADSIAAKLGIVADSDFRIKSGIIYTLVQAGGSGHTYLPQDVLENLSRELLELGEMDLANHLMDMQMDKRIIVKEKKNEDGTVTRNVYASQFYYRELDTAKMLKDLSIQGDEPEDAIRETLARIQKQENIELDELQVKAVISAVNNGLMIVTGGPGTGKTTTIKTILRYFELGNMDILMAAPTGRAAKRMTEATGWEAKTIHRLLEITGIPDDEDRTRGIGMHFERNEENPLDADVIIIDEMSMVDITLMHALLKAVNVGTRLILVGDMDQLPSVGPGNVLKDIIECGEFPVVRLTRIFRQAAQSDIIVNAHKINAGERIDLEKRSKDFLFIKRNDANSIINAMLTLVQKKLPDYVHADVSDIQVMTPMRKGLLGVERLNEIMQQFLNPESPSKAEKENAGRIFREGDKVMQIKNNYLIEWKQYSRRGIVIDEGTGVFNGDTGIVKEINTFAETMTVEFEGSRQVEYSFKQLEELEHAYAITIHKSQGSEYPAVVIPMASGPRMLMTRNLLYTAVTRARSCVCMVGVPEIFYQMAENTYEQKRYSGLKDRIMELRDF